MGAPLLVTANWHDTLKILAKMIPNATYAKLLLIKPGTIARETIYVTRHGMTAVLYDYGIEVRFPRVY